MSTRQGGDPGGLFNAYSAAWFTHRQLLNNRVSFIRQNGEAAFGAALAQAENAMSQAYAAHTNEPLQPRAPAVAPTPAEPPGMLGGAFGKRRA